VPDIVNADRNTEEDEMKKLAIFTLAVWALGGMAFAEEGSDLEGAWEFVSGTFTDANGTGEMTAKDRTALKVVTGEHFSIVARQPDGTFAHAGRCKTEGDKYTEQVEWGTDPDLVGKTYTFESKVDGDTWTISGKMENLGLTLKEVWHRVKK
jgi:hypothetical protein